MVNFLSRFGRRWRALSSATREVIVVACLIAIAWVVIEGTQTCDAFFEFVEHNPDLEIDSALMALILGAIGVTGLAIRRYRELAQANKARDEAEGHAQRMAYHDALTGLQNRRALNEKLARMGAEAGLERVGLIILDLDRFKPVNDFHGHGAGDRLLRLVADRLRQELMVGQTMYRLGGDEFACVMELGENPGSMATHLAQRCIDSMSRPFEDGGLVHHIGASAGIAIYPEDAHDRESLMRRADMALYRAKEGGRGQYRVYETYMDASIRRRAEIERKMREALAAKSFAPHYQPIVDLQTGKTVGFELLARWLDDGVEVVAPNEFIPIAEECGLINDVLLSLIERTCEEARDWDPRLTIAINISPVQLKDPWLSEKVLAVLARQGFAPQRLAIEITENAIIADSDNAKRLVESFKNQGMQIGLDDFGTGYSSLHHLRLLPFDKIKIDRSFISAIVQDAEALKIVRAIYSMAHSLGLPIVAEGIECSKTADILRGIGCAQGQGYLYGAAIAGKKVPAFLHAENTALTGARMAS